MDPISLVAGGVVLLAGYVLGRINRHPPKERPNTDPTKCPGCRHGLTYRDPVTGHCTAMQQQADMFDEDGKPVQFTYVRCTCQSHTTAEQLMLETATWRRPEIGPSRPEV